MLAAEVPLGGDWTMLTSDREVTRLGASVFESGMISQEAMELVCGFLRRMAGAYQKLEVAGVRAVATAAVRDASNQAEFLARASESIGAPVEIISGQEEARLVHLGIQTQWPHPDKRVLIADIGGGSLEVIVSQNGRIEESFSKPLGAVRLTGLFMKHDPPKKKQLQHLREFIDEKLAPVVHKIGVQKFDRVIGTSSTAAAMVCSANRVPRARRDEADRRRTTTAQARKLLGKLQERDRSKRARITGIGPRRAEIIVAGVSVLLQVMEKLQLPSMYYSTAGVRDGIIADLAARRVGSEQALLSREQRAVVEQMARKYSTPFAGTLKHARQVARFGRTLFEALEQLHRLPPYWGKLLEAASYLYETGLFVSDTGHHKHSAYLIENSGLAGFTDRERTLIAQLCRFHRKSMPAARHADYQALSPEDRKALLLLIPLLRLADALDRGKEQRVEALGCQVRDGRVLLQIKGSGKIALEEWSGEQVGGAFEQVYGKKLEVERA
ncbi:MAG: Ppx/GppA family phosphatase [Acidimicrobiia bacterium]|nr:Ppx/GppA family phosphatase [Acidimicrobiia bacterium]